MHRAGLTHLHAHQVVGVWSRDIHGGRPSIMWPQTLSMVGPSRGPGGLAQRAQGQRVWPTSGRRRKVQLSPCGPARIWRGGPRPGLLPLCLLSDVRKTWRRGPERIGQEQSSTIAGTGHPTSSAPRHVRKPGTGALTGSPRWGH